MPALLTSTSMRPSSPRARSTMAARSERFVTSVGSASAFRPRLRTSFRGALGALGVQLGHDDVGAEARQLQRGGAADALATARDDGDATAELAAFETTHGPGVYRGPRPGPSRDGMLDAR